MMGNDIRYEIPFCINCRFDLQIRSMSNGDPEYILLI
jgi:hypothetical protein